MHVDTDLSAYLDGELAPADRTRVEAHLGSCDRCRARLGELRSTASLMAALPSPRPARSLVPRVVERLNWLRPLRSFSTFATGAFLFVFLVTAVGRSGTGLGGGAAVPFGAPGAAPQAAPAAASAPERATTAFATPQPLPAAPGAGPAATARTDAATPTPAALAAQPSPPKAADAQREADSRGSPESADGAREISRTPPPLTDPFLWLGLAVIAAILAIGAHWRLRTT